MNTAKLMILVSVVLLIAGLASGYILRPSSASFALYHVGGLGALGLLASLTGVIAWRKGFQFWRGFLPSLVLSITLGAIAAYLVPPAEGVARPAACGGSVSLGVAVAVLGIWMFVKRRNQAGV